MNLIQIKNLTKDEIFKAVNLNFEAGKTYTIVGSKKSGKSLLLRLLSGNERAEHETFELNFDLQRELGFVAQRDEELLPDERSVEEVLELHHAYYQIDQHISLSLRSLQMTAYQKTRIGNLSPFEKRKLSFLLATVHQPKLLLLDEPTAGLQAYEILEFHAWIRSFQKSGATVIMTSREIQFAKSLSSEVYFIEEAKVKAVHELADNQVYEIPKKIVTRSYDKADILYEKSGHLVVATDKIQQIIPDILGFYLNGFQCIAHYLREKSLADILKNQQYLEGLQAEEKGENML